jgi:hypothetical protein
LGWVIIACRFTENAVKTQIWIAVAVYVLVAIIKKRMQLRLSLYTILQVLSLTLFEKMPLYQSFAERAYKNKIATIDNHLNRLKNFGSFAEDYTIPRFRLCDSQSPA